MNATDIANVALVPMASPMVTMVKHVPQPIEPKSISGLRPNLSMRRVIKEPQHISEMKSTPDRIRASLGLNPNELVRMTGK